MHEVVDAKYHNWFLALEISNIILSDILLPSAIFCIVFFSFWKPIRSIHTSGMKIISYLIIIVKITTAFLVFKLQDSSKELRYLETLDFLITAFLIAQVIVSRRITIKFKNNTYEQIPYYREFTLTHRILGYTIYTLSVLNQRRPFTNCLYPNSQFLVFGIKIVFPFLYFFLYLSKWNNRRFHLGEQKDTDWIRDLEPVDKNAKEKLFSPDEIFQMIERGRYILMYNNFVLDVTELSKNHPGSREVLKQRIGTNISLVLEGHYLNHGELNTHSNIAFRFVRRSVIGKIIENSALQVPLRKELKNNFLLQKFTLIDREKISPKVYRLVFQSDSFYYFACGRQNRLGGQHFNINFRNGTDIVKRFFTISNALERFRYSVINNDKKLRSLRYFKHDRRQEYAKRVILNEIDYYNDPKVKENAKKGPVNTLFKQFTVSENLGISSRMDVSSNLRRNSVLANHKSRQERELDNEINPWHNGEVVCFVQEMESGWSEFLISSSLNTQFTVEGAWGLGLDLFYHIDQRIVVICQGQTLLTFCDVLSYLEETTHITGKMKNKTLNDRLFFDFYVFQENLDDAYALGYDLLEYVTKVTGVDWFQVKSQLFLKEEPEQNQSLFDFECKKKIFF